MLVLESDGSLINFLILELDLLFLELSLLKLFVALNHVTLGKLAKDLKLVEELPLSVKECGLLL